MGNDKHGSRATRPAPQRRASAAAASRAAQSARAARPAEAAERAERAAGRTRAAGRPAAAPARGLDARQAVAATVEGLGYELVELERAARGLLRVTVDRVAGRQYAEPGDALTLGDCEQITRQLQYALEVEGVDYARLEVSSPGLDRPLRQAADYARFAGARVHLALREPLAGRRHFEGLLGAGADGRWQLALDGGEAVLGFALDEVREARLVPVLDFKGRRGAGGSATEETAAPRAPAAGTDQEVSR